MATALIKRVSGVFRSTLFGLLAGIIVLLSASSAMAQSTSQTLFTTQFPSIANNFSNAWYELGMKFRSVKAGRITALRFYRAAGDNNFSHVHVGRLWTANGTLLASATFSSFPTIGWQQATLAVPVNIAANTTYIVSANTSGNTSGSYYPVTIGGLSTQIARGDLRSVVGGNGVYANPGGFPNTPSQASNNYFRDVVFVANPTSTINKVSGDTQSATVSTRLSNPLVVQVRNSSNVPVQGVLVTFAVTGGGGAVSPVSVTTDVNGNARTALTLGGFAGSNSVNATASGVGAVTFTATGVAITRMILKASGDSQSANVGIRLPSPFVAQVRNSSNFPVSGAVVTFAITTGNGSLTSTSVTTDANGNATTFLTLGTTAGVNSVSANSIGATTATFNATGLALTTAISKVSGDSQSATVGTSLANPLVVQVRNSNNVAVPGVVVNFAVTGGGGSASPISATTDVNGNAHTSLILGSTAGTNSVTATAAGAGTVTFTATGTSMVTTSIAKISGDGQSGAIGTQLTSPLVVQVRNSNNVAVTGAVVSFAVTGGGGTLSTGSAITDANGNASAMLTLGASAGTNSVSASAPNAGSVTFTATGTGVVVTSQQIFTTQVPVLPDANDGVSYELGMKFRSARSGKISAIRYWKASSDAGTHIGRIWDASGTLLASVTFSGETASGWQQQALAAPLSILANTTYTVSVNINTNYAFTNAGLATSIVNGDLSSVADGANGTYGTLGTFPNNSFQNSNYFRDIVFAADAVSTNTLAKISGDGQSGAIGTQLTSPLVVQVRNSNNVAVTGAVVSFAVTGGGGTLSTGSAITDANGNASAMLTLGASAGTNSVSASAPNAGSVTFTATGTGVVVTSQQIFTTQVPVLPDANDGVSYELGMKFRSARSGKISAIRYWKASSDAGTHIGRIWDASGTLLASVTFSGETASGWQQQALAAPLSILANTTYTVSVNINTNYAFTNAGLATSIVNGDLSSVADGANGTYGTLGTFPNNSFQNSNYFRDIVFAADATSATMVKVSGDNQTGLPGTALANPLVVQVNDGNNNPQAGVTVTFSVTSGGGTISPSTAITDANGRASTNLTLGAAGESNTVSATSASAGSVTFSAIGGPNAIYLENQKPGTNSWRITNYTTTSIAGYASALSVQRGGSLPIKVSLAAPGSYSIDIYRIGYYAGAGARLVASSGSLSGVVQPACPVTDSVTHLVECNWSTSYTLAVGSDWTTGLYLAKLKLTSTSQESPIFFVVRDDASTAKILFQSSFANSAAYNRYGGYSLYDFNSTGGQRAYKVSFDRPTRELEEYSNLLRYEYNMIRWMESQGYDVSYVTNLDIHTNPGRLSQHKVLLDAGHNEYWSLEMRNAVENARDAGMHMAFFSANTAYWRVRFEPSTTGMANRVMVCYKTMSPADPVAATVRFRDPQVNRPENALMGVMYIGNHGALYGGFDHVVSNAADPYYAFTGLNNGDKLSGLVGYEWDAIVDNGFSPTGMVTLASSPVTATEFAPGVPAIPAQTAHAVRYTTASGAKVFSSGSIQWVWGLDSDRGFDFVTPPRVDVRVQQMFVNILRDMGVRPTTPNANLVVP